MSFIGKAVKKIFKIGRKIVKGIGRAFENKWFRIAFLVGLSVFTIGLGSAGFAGFGAAQAAAVEAGASTIGAFFSAVGTTMATGFSTITGAVSGLFGGAGAAAPGVVAPLSSTVAVGGSGTALLAEAGLGVTTASTLPSSLIGAGVTNAATAGGVSLASRAMGMLTSPTLGGTFMRNAIVGGISSWSKGKELDYNKRVNKRLNFYGGPARGGSAEVPEGLIRSPFPQSTPESSTARQIAVDPSNPITDSRNFSPRGGALLSRSTRIKDLPSVAGLLNPQPQGV